MNRIACLYQHYLPFLSIFSLFLAIYQPLKAQWTVSNPSISLQEAVIQNNARDQQSSSQGILISFGYESQERKKKLITSLLTLRLIANGEEIYTQNSDIWVLKSSKKVDSLYVFIPYRNIRGRAEEPITASLQLQASGLGAYQRELNFTLPHRYKAVWDLQSGEVKKQLKEYDPKESPRNWPPDPSIGIFLNDGSQPIAQISPRANQYQLGQEQIGFYLQSGDSATVRIYDEDGDKDLLLAEIPLPKCIGDAVFPFYGQQTGQIRNLYHQIQYQQLVVQPINLSAREGRHNGAKGVFINARFDLARIYEGKSAKVELLLYDEQGRRIKPEQVENLHKSPVIGQFARLKLAGEWDYFIPFYGWSNQVRKIELSLLPYQSEPIRSTPCLLPNGIVFEEPVRYARLKVEEKGSYQGCSGVFVRFDYSLNTELQNYLQLAVRFSPQGENLRFYQLSDSSYQQDSFFVHNLPDPEQQLSYFIPYVGLKQQERFNLSCFVSAGGSKIEVLPDTVINIKAQSSKDIALSLQKIDDYVLENDYGKQFFIQSKLPFFLQNKSQLSVKVQRNGEDFRQYRLSGLVDSSGRLLNTDNGYLLLPYRYWNGRDSLSVYLCAIDQHGNELSEPISYHYRLPEVINVQEMRVEIASLRVNKKSLPKDSSQTSLGWGLQLRVGGEILKIDSLPAKLRLTRADKNKLRADFKAHREDKISHILTQYAADSSARSLQLWKADWGKIQQLQHQQLIGKKAVLATMKVWILPARVAKSPIRRLFFKSYHQTKRLLSPPKKRKR